jgi:uncharacterized protein YecT (DUF1311 family)
MLALLTTLVFAQDPAAPASPADPYDTCLQTAETTIAMSECNAAEYQRQDTRLNAVYKELREQLGDDEARTKLKKAELAWIAFRDTECEFEADENRGGTLEGINYGGCRIHMTRERADVLQGILDSMKSL